MNGYGLAAGPVKVTRAFYCVRVFHITQNFRIPSKEFQYCNNVIQFRFNRCHQTM